MVSERDESLLSYLLVEHTLLENVTLERPRLRLNEDMVATCDLSSMS